MAEPWPQLDPVALVDHIETTHHRYAWNELPRVHALVEKVVAAHRTRHPELTEVGARFAELRANLEPHLLKEERVLFPMIRQLAQDTNRATSHYGPITNPIS